MKFRLPALLGVLAAFLVAAIAVPSFAADKPRVAVIEFKNKADNQYWWSGGAEAIQDKLVTGLVKSGKFRVLEREQLAAIMREKNLTLSGDVDPSTAMQIGKLLGVNYLLTGAVTEYGLEEKGGRGPGFRKLPSFSVKKRSFTGAVDARLINVDTGEIVWADDARAVESNAKVSVGGFGGGVDDRRMFDKVMEPIVGELIASMKAADI